MLQPGKHLSPRGRDKSVPRSCYIHQLVSVIVADDEGVNAVWSGKISANNELLPTIHAMLGVEGMNCSICFSAKSDYFAETKALAELAVRFYTKVYLEPFTVEETIEDTRSVFSTPPDTTAIIAAWLHEKTLGQAYVLAFVCKHLSAAENQIQPRQLEVIWTAIFDQLGREKFRSEISQLSAQDRALVREFASLGGSEIPAHHLTGKIHRQYLARLLEKGLLVRTGRGR